jgi:dolichyl-phosphate-mannose-protein mannosyltransferase
MARAGRILLVAAALAMLGYRFVHVDLAPFARDEPQFLAAAREQLRTGHWLSANPLYGNLGLRYGATAFWFYGIVQALFGDDPRVAIVAMGLTVTLAQLALAFALTRLFDQGAVFFAALVAWIASSPYPFLWSRLAWDLTSNAAVFAAAALLCSYRQLRPARAAALGVVVGLGLSTHPMLAPLAIAVLVAVAWEWRGRGREAMPSAAALAFGMAVVNVPYLLFLLKAPIVGRTPRQPLSPEGLGSLVLQAPRIATVWGLPYYFGGAWSEFQLWLGRFRDEIDVLAVASLVLCVAATLGGVAAALAASDPRHRRVGLAALVAWVGNVVLLAMLGLEGHPHYHFASAWVPVFGMAAALAWLQRRRPRLGAAALAVLAVIGLAQFAVIVQWMGFIRATGGTRSPSYGTPIGLQIEAMQAACATPEPLVVLRNETEMFPFPLAYIATTEPACRGKTVVVCADTPRPLTKPCPPPTAGERRRRLRYARETGGALAVE